ncbi:efflux RND transporter permease subunit [Dissulfurirhabdus thermomarina]|uniref:Efflux RND transporter permease subunit n=1 Tax=Dissulfurirhabdus thermomarina TaxID=1765737 RepID=A0A6N9TSB4_DISTH|nr:efflux RND transporter permease subunit [Dissulfurirhabdus thermomarina]NDY42983.1 efflux RND transporter permease subunit [Dissulfurirhabdus thermomarina]NMX23800.1 efflux RND transporter permease subunit [Dissulfurirhabdus thermomarina]
MNAPSGTPTPGPGGRKTFVEAYLERPYLITSFILLAAALGFIGFKAMPLNLFPDANYPVIAVIIPEPGAAASDVEDKVTRTVEKELATIDLVRKVRSVSQDEMAAVSVEFEYAKSLDAAATDVANALKRIEAKLPPDIQPPEIFRVSDATNPVFTLALAPRPGSHLDLAKVRQLADNEIREALLRVPDVANVEVFGGYAPEVTVEVDPRRLHAHGLSLAQVIAAIRAQNLNIPDGLVFRDGGQYLVKTQGERLEKARLLDIVVGREAGGEVHLGDVADVRTGYRERQSLYRGNGHPAIGVNILRPEKGHVTTTIAALERALPAIRARFPDVTFEVADTQKTIIETSISNMVDALRDAIVMTVAVIFLILANTRISLLAAVSIPFTYFLTFAAMYVFGYELNIVTLTAMIVAVGLLLDGAIVVIENIERHFRELGKDIHRAVVDGVNEILLANWAGVFTSAIVLVPIMFIGGYVEKILRQFTVVLAMALLVSYAVSVTVIPLLARHVVKAGTSRNRVERWVSHVGRYLVDPVRDFFAGLIEVALRHRGLFLLVAALLFVASMRQMPLAGRDLMPPMDTGIVKIAFETDSDSSLAATEAVAARIEAVLQDMPGVERISTTVGSEPGVVSFGTGRIPQQGLVTVHFVDRFHRKETIWELEAAIRKRAAAIPGLKSLDVFDFGATPLSSIAASVDVMISGPDPAVLDRLADDVAARIRRVRGLTTVSRSWTLDKTEWRIRVDQEKAARYGLDPVEISRQLTEAVRGGPASVLRVPGEDGYVVRVRYPAEARDSRPDIEAIQVRTRIGPVPLAELARVTRARTRTRFTRQDLEPTVDVYGYRATTAITHLQGRIQKALAGLRLPPGYTLRHEGEIKNMEEAGRRLKRALGLAVVLLFFSLAPTFRSWLNPLTIMTSIPLAMIGAAWGLLLTGRHACMPANMGMILLAGIVVNNSILLIDFIEKSRAEGVPLREAIERAVRVRTRPILMTALGTIVGMLPIAAERALGLERLSPLAVVAIGGLFVSTLLTLIYVPIFYTLFEDLRAWARGVAEGLARRAGKAPARGR